MDRDPKLTTGEQVGTTRRGFLGFLTLVLGTAPFIGGLFLMLRTGLSPTKDNRPGKFRLCRLSEVPAAGSTDIKEFIISYKSRLGPRVESISKVVFLTRDPAGDELLAMSGECTHLGCPVQRRDLSVEQGSEAPLICPCHEGKFSRAGEVLAGAPKQPLRRLKLDALPVDPDADVYLLEI